MSVGQRNANGPRFSIWKNLINQSTARFCDAKNGLGDGGLRCFRVNSGISAFWSSTDITYFERTTIHECQPNILRTPKASHSQSLHYEACKSVGRCLCNAAGGGPIPSSYSPNAACIIPSSVGHGYNFQQQHEHLTHVH